MHGIKLARIPAAINAQKYEWPCANLEAGRRDILAKLPQLLPRLGNLASLFRDIAEIRSV